MSCLEGQLANDHHHLGDIGMMVGDLTNVGNLATHRELKANQNPWPPPGLNAPLRLGQPNKFELESNIDRSTLHYPDTNAVFAPNRREDSRRLGVERCWGSVDSCEFDSRLGVGGGRDYLAQSYTKVLPRNQERGEKSGVNMSRSPRSRCRRVVFMPI